MDELVLLILKSILDKMVLENRIGFGWADRITNYRLISYKMNDQVYVCKCEYSEPNSWLQVPDTLYKYIGISISEVRDFKINTILK